jgi:L-fuculose-phosphate aldolase
MRHVSEPELRRHLVEICHRMYRQGMIAAGDGNVSAKIEDERILVTPSGFHKGFIKEEDLIVVDARGKKLKGPHKPSSEFLMHEVAYELRPDIGAVVHAHPPITVGLALSGYSMAQCVLSETCLVLGPILTAPYTTPTTREVPDTLRPYLRQANAVVLDRHGALTLGRDLDEAYNRMEAMEHASKITHAALALGPVKPLGGVEVDKLQMLAKQFGIARAPDPCTLCNACPSGSGGPAKQPAAATAMGGADPTDAIVEAVLRKIRGGT